MKEESEKSWPKTQDSKTKIMASSAITSWQIHGETMETLTDFLFLGSKNQRSDCSHKIKGHLLLGRTAMSNLDSVLKSRDITLLTKFRIVKAMVFLVVMYRCESWTIKKSQWWLMFLNSGAREDSWESLGSKEIKPVNPEGSQPWIFIGTTDAKTEAPILWPSDGKTRLIGKDPDAGKDWRQE